MELVGENAVDRLKKIAGPIDPNVAKVQEPSSIIALFGFDEIHNSFYYAPSVSVAAKVLFTAFFFFFQLTFFSFFLNKIFVIL